MPDWIVIILLSLSISLNAFLIWYCQKVVMELYEVSENIKVLTEEIISFDEHLKSVHELEVFYGDSTLGSLMQHSTALTDTLEDFVEIYGLFDEETEAALTEEVLDDADAEA
tara:strand:- start:5075 stop:5410 length:336 start_codon:yes stop_codon:yes gene_type:complete